MILVTGVTGYLGSELARLGGDDVVGTSLSRDAVDVRDREALDRLLADSGAGCVIHTAYRQRGDDAEDINVRGAETVAAAAQAAGARLIHISSDLVFRGDLGRPLREDDAVDPITEYGATKAAGEDAVRAAHPGALIVRTSLIYGGPDHPGGPSGHETFALEAARGVREAVFFANEIRSPVNVFDLARVLLVLTQLDLSGVLHAAGAEPIDRFKFAQLIASAYGEDPGVLVPGDSGPNRPADCALDSSRAAVLLSGLTPASGESVPQLRGATEILTAP